MSFVCIHFMKREVNGFNNVNKSIRFEYLGGMYHRLKNWDLFMCHRFWTKDLMKSIELL